MKQDIRTDTQYSTAPSPTAPSPTAPLEGDLYSVEPVAAPYVFGGSNVDIPYAHATAVEVVHECDREREHKAITPTDPEERVPVAWPTGAPNTQPPQTPGSVATQQATAHQNNNNSSNNNNKRRKTPSCCCICIGATCCLVIVVICAIVGIIGMGYVFAY